MFQRGEKNLYDLSDFHYGVTDSARRGGLIISQTADLLRFSHNNVSVSSVDRNALLMRPD